jgi:hypothetical protein
MLQPCQKAFWHFEQPQLLLQHAKERLLASMQIVFLMYLRTLSEVRLLPQDDG